MLEIFYFYVKYEEKCRLFQSQAKTGFDSLGAYFPDARWIRPESWPCWRDAASCSSASCPACPAHRPPRGGGTLCNTVKLPFNFSFFFFYFFCLSTPAHRPPRGGGALCNTVKLPFNFIIYSIYTMQHTVHQDGGTLCNTVKTLRTERKESLNESNFFNFFFLNNFSITK